MQADNNLDITLIMTTFNRADVLNHTLGRMAKTDRTGIKTEFVIVDNNSKDKTRDVILRWKNILNIKYLWEQKPGQNPARNRALKEAKLGRIVVFTDDDVVPEPDWFTAILQACRLWPEYSIFGGRIYPIWPANTDFPKWADEKWIQSFGFAVQDYSQHECVYEKKDYPFSPNFWVRRKVLENKLFNEKIEWHPKNRIMATETTFFKDLVEDGYRIVYCPKAVVGHKINPDQLTIKSILKRSYSCGRGLAYIRTFCKSEMLNDSPLLWYAIRYAAITRLGIKLTGAILPLAFEKPQSAIYAMQWLGYNIELLNLANQNKK